MTSAAIKDPTFRKAVKRGFTPIRYRLAIGKSYDECRNGWEISRDEKHIVLRLVGEDRNRRVPLSEGRFITKL